MPPTHVPHHVPPNHRTHPHLHCTYMHHPVHLCSHLVLVSYAETHYHIPMTHSSPTHSFLIWYASWSLSCFWWPVSQIMSLIYFTYIMSHLYQVSPPSCFLNPVLYLALFTVSPSYSDSDPDLPMYINPWETPLCLLSLTWSLIPSLVFAPLSFYYVTFALPVVV